MMKRVTVRLKKWSNFVNFIFHQILHNFPKILLFLTRCTTQTTTTTSSARTPENNKASNCSSGLLYFCLLCSNLRDFRSTHCFTVKWKSALDCTFLVQLFENLPFFAIANGFVKRIHVKIPRLNGFRFIRIVKQQFFDRFWDL